VFHFLFPFLKILFYGRFFRRAVVAPVFCWLHFTPNLEQNQDDSENFCAVFGVFV